MAAIATGTGFTYHLEYNTGTYDGNWRPVAATVGDGTIKKLVDSFATNSLGFYRIGIE